MRTMKRLLWLPLLMVLFAPAVAGEGGEIEWMTDPSDALRAAEEQNRLLLVDAWAPWCAPCFEMDETTWKDPGVAEAVDPFVRLKINHDVQKLFVERYAIEHLPILLVLDPAGDEVTRVYGFHSAEQVRTLSDRLLTGYEAFAEAADARKDPEAQARAAEFLLEVGGYPRALKICKKALRRAKGDAALTARLSLALGEAQLGDGQARAATRTFSELLEDLPGTDQARGRALLGLVRSERERGRDDEADAALQQLREDFPDLAEGV